MESSGLQAAGRRIHAGRASLKAVADMSGHSGPCPRTQEMLEHRTACLSREIQQLRRLGTIRFPRPAKAGRGLGRGADALSRTADPLSRRASRVGLSAAGTSGPSRPAPTHAASPRPRPLRGARRKSQTRASSQFHPTFKLLGALEPDTLISAPPTAVLRQPQPGTMFAQDPPEKHRPT